MDDLRKTDRKRERERERERRYWTMMEEVLDHPRWGTRFAMAYGPVVRQNAQKHLHQEN